LAGNLMSVAKPGGITAFTWDARQRLTSLTGPGVESAFSYDALGRRQSRQINGLVTRTLYDGLTPVADQGTASQSYLASPRLDEPWSPNTNELYLADALGSIVGLTDASGALTTRYTYDPF